MWTRGVLGGRALYPDTQNSGATARMVLGGGARPTPRWDLRYAPRLVHVFLPHHAPRLTSRRSLRDFEGPSSRHPPQLVIDRAVQEGKGDRPALLVPRKNNRVLTLALTDDLVDAIRWHVRQGYAGPDFLFSQDAVSTSGSMRIRGHFGPFNAHSVCENCRTTKLVGIRWQARQQRRATRSEPFKLSSGICPRRVQSNTPTWEPVHSSGWCTI